MLVWTAAVRLSHWLLAGLVLFNLFNETGPMHRYAGYVAALTVALRLAYGLSRSRGDFAHVGLPAPSLLMQHLRELRTGRVHRSLGHNPAGMLMAWLLWLLVLALGVSGWMTQLDAYWGEDWLIETHEAIAWVLQGSVLVHWAGVLIMSRLQKENLLRAMITGRKAP
ncbi:MAG TPA: cytochrome b/b6 domain-containing protein [Aquabacterium sp.]|uniref:cytochrome b/b6 domain-containing protein n=1 Tax=Aquabacterium sp. TaxID=1872578 RepID=UPI002E315C4F|nr:cytochrome b/b6 domain-containing protein [Aquabacterium sp.]HEX5356910.1 cytochrome b/b6 domain-containing protein [Aquabacterium sp.]